MTSKIPKVFRHINIRKSIPYEVATELQKHVVDEHLAFKALRSDPSHLDSPSPAPLPTIFTFSSSPVYTLGRRDKISSMSKSAIDQLIRPMPGLGKGKDGPSEPHRALLFETQRGGQTTFHGPGQLLIWPVLDIKNAWPARGPLNVRDYVRLLEECTILTLRRFGCESKSTKHPGIWEPKGIKKIAAIGVNLRRNISSYGVGCNLSTDLRFFDRIVACGLHDKGTTSFRQLQGKGVNPDEFAHNWVCTMVKLLYGDTLRPLSPAIIKRSVKDVGVGPEILRRLWYLEASLSDIKWAQKVKKIRLESPHAKSEENETKDPHNDESSPNNATPASDKIKGRVPMEDLIAALDQNEKATRPSFRKCAGISYWTPPTDSKTLHSLIRKVPVMSD